MITWAIAWADVRLATSGKGNMEGLAYFAAICADAYWLSRLAEGVL